MVDKDPASNKGICTTAIVHYSVLLCEFHFIKKQVGCFLKAANRLGLANKLFSMPAFYYFNNSYNRYYLTKLRVSRIGA